MLKKYLEGAKKAVRPLDDAGNSWIGGTFGALWRTLRRFGDAIATAQLGRGLAQVLGQVAGAFCRRMVLLMVWAIVVLGDGDESGSRCGCLATVVRRRRTVVFVLVENCLGRLWGQLIVALIVVQTESIWRCRIYKKQLMNNYPNENSIPFNIENQVTLVNNHLYLRQ